METRTEDELCAAASLLLRDTKHNMYSENHLHTLFSIGLTNLGVERKTAYDEHDANKLLIFMVERARTF